MMGDADVSSGGGVGGGPCVESLLRETGALREGHFVLSSGLHSDRYCQCARLFDDPRTGGEVAGLMASRLDEMGIECDVVVAPALGGVLWGYELARALGVRSAFAERKGDASGGGGGGGFSLRRGFSIGRGERVVLAEDVVTTGGSIAEVGRLVESLGGEVVAYACVADRSRGEFRPAGSAFVSLIELEFRTFESGAVPEWLASIEVERPGSRSGGVVAERGDGHGDG